MSKNAVLWMGAGQIGMAIARRIGYGKKLVMGPQGAFITGSDFLIDGGATASYYYGPLQPEAN